MNPQPAQALNKFNQRTDLQKARLEQKKAKLALLQQNNQFHKGLSPSFFVLERVDGDKRDTSGQSRVPNKAQQEFLAKHYPGTTKQFMSMIEILSKLHQSAQAAEMRQ